MEVAWHCASASNSATYAAQGREMDAHFPGAQIQTCSSVQTAGHKDVRTTMQYQHPELEIVRDALNATQSHDDPVLFGRSTAHYDFVR
jgi:hypothetical protein